MFQLREAVEDGLVERHEERQLAGVPAQGGMQVCGHLRTPTGVEVGVLDLLDELPHRHREPVSCDGFARHQGAGRHDRVAAVGEPARDRQLHTLLGGLRVRVGGDRAWQDRGHAYHHRSRREVHHDGEDVVEHPWLGHGQPEIAVRGGRGGDRPAGAVAHLLVGDHRSPCCHSPGATTEMVGRLSSLFTAMAGYPCDHGHRTSSGRRPGQAVTREVSAVAAGERVLHVPAHGGVLVFDGHCGFCTRAVHAVLRLDRRGRVRALPLQGPQVLALTGLTREAALHEAWWIGADGVRLGGAGAMSAAVSAVTGVPVVRAYRLPGLRAVADRGYRWVAEHRRVLPGVTPYCTARPEACCDADVG